MAVGSDEDPPGRQALNANAFVSPACEERSLAAAVCDTLAGLMCAPRDIRWLLAKPTFSHREKEVVGKLVAGHTIGRSHGGCSCRSGR